MKKLPLFALLALGALVAPANAQQASSAFILSACGTLPAGVTYAAGQFGILTMDTTGKLCDSATGGGGGSGAVFGPTAAGSAAANPPVIVGGTADGTATGNVVNWKVLAGIGYINCANCSGSGVSSVDEVAFVAGTSLFAGTGGFFQTTATSNALTSGQQGMFQVTANRALFSNLRNAAGAEIGVAAAPVQVSLANTAANATPVLVNQPTGTNLHAVLDTTSTTAVTQATGTNLHAVLDTTSTTAVTQATGTNLHTVVDNATPGIANNADAIAAVAASATSPVPVNNYNYVYNGATFDRMRSGTTTGSVLINGAGTAGAASGGVLTIQGAASMTKLLVTPDSVALPANQSVNVAQFGGTSTATGQVAASVAPVTATNTALVVDLRPDSPGIIATGGATTSNSVPMILNSQYPVNSVTTTPTALTASTTGTTAATAASLSAAASVTNFVCGFDVTADATALATGTAVLSGTISGSLSYLQTITAAANGTSQLTRSFTPCIPASGANVAITITSAAAGTGGNTIVNIWGYRL